jgi:hypothetical protein
MAIFNAEAYIKKQYAQETLGIGIRKELDRTI